MIDLNSLIAVLFLFASVLVSNHYNYACVRLTLPTIILLGVASIVDIVLKFPYFSAGSLIVLFFVFLGSGSIWGNRRDFDFREKKIDDSHSVLVSIPQPIREVDSYVKVTFVIAAAVSLLSNVSILCFSFLHAYDDLLVKLQFVMFFSPVFAMMIVFFVAIEEKRFYLEEWLPVHSTEEEEKIMDVEYI